MYNIYMNKKERVDLLLVERGLAGSRSVAQRLVMAGQVRANGQVVGKPSVTLPMEVLLEVDPGPRFVSRGGEKLEAALETFRLDVAGMVCADVGASTGGFTDCLLQHGAARVYAVDVGKGIIHWNLRREERVVIMEGINARFIEKLPESVALLTMDVSFISLKVLFPVVRNWLLMPKGQVIALVKPQFEAGRKLAARAKGVIRDPEVHRQVLDDVLRFARDEGYRVLDVIRSPVIGPKGNAEFLAWLDLKKGKTDLDKLINCVVSVEQ